jgi:hypothetical protein
MISPGEFAQHERVEPIGLPARDRNRSRAAATLFGCSASTRRRASSSCSTSSPSGPLDRDQPDLHPHEHTAQRGQPSLVVRIPRRNRGSLTIARKLARRSDHLLRALGPAALDPPDTTPANRSDQAHTSTMRPTRAASSSSGRGTHTTRGGPRKTERPQSLHRNDRSTISSPTATTGSRGPR